MVPQNTRQNYPNFTKKCVWERSLTADSQSPKDCSTVLYRDITPTVGTIRPRQHEEDCRGDDCLLQGLMSQDWWVYDTFLRQSTCMSTFMRIMHFLLIMGIAREFAWDQASTAVADRVANCDVVIPWEAISNILYTSIYPPCWLGKSWRFKIGEWVYSTLHKSNPGNVPMLDHLDHPLECFFCSVEIILIIIPRTGSLSGWTSVCLVSLISLLS